jgi:hypothetical protein
MNHSIKIVLLLLEGNFTLLNAELSINNPQRKKKANNLYKFGNSGALEH